MTPHEFLNLLWQYKPEEQYALIWTAPNKQSHWFRDLAKAGEFVAGVRSGAFTTDGVGCAAVARTQLHRQAKLILAQADEFAKRGVISCQPTFLVQRE